MTFANKLSVAGALALSLSLGAAHAETFEVIRASNAAEALQPGDLMFSVVRTGGKWHQALIRTAQKGFQAFSKHFRGEMKKGDAAATHVGMYVGNGEIAEAYGKTPQDALVKTRSLDEHAAESWLVYRPRNKALAARAVTIARLWADKTMRFRTPVHLPFMLSNYGPKARVHALDYGKNASRKGGPLGTRSMFCSQFVLAVYQAAHVAPKLEKNPKLTANQLEMPRALRLHATNVSPVALIGSLRLTVKDAANGWQEVSAVQIDPALYKAAPSTASMLKDVFRKMGNRLLEKLKLKKKKKK